MFLEYQAIYSSELNNNVRPEFVLICIIIP